MTIVEANQHEDKSLTISFSSLKFVFGCLFFSSKKDSPIELIGPYSTLSRQDFFS